MILGKRVLELLCLQQKTKTDTQTSRKHAITDVNGKYNNVIGKTVSKIVSVIHLESYNE